MDFRRSFTVLTSILFSSIKEPIEVWYEVINQILFVSFICETLSRYCNYTNLLLILWFCHYIFAKNTYFYHHRIFLCYFKSFFQIENLGIIPRKSEICHTTFSFPIAVSCRLRTFWSSYFAGFWIYTSRVRSKGFFLLIWVFYPIFL